MSEQEKQRSKEYSRVRDTFGKLTLDEQASFLVEAVFSTVTRGIERASETVTEELNTLFEQAQRSAEAGEEKPRQGTQSKDGTKAKKAKGTSAGKKSAKKKTGSRKKTSRKSKKSSPS